MHTEAISSCIIKIGITMRDTINVVILNSLQNKVNKKEIEDVNSL